MSNTKLRGLNGFIELVEDPRKKPSRRPTGSSEREGGRVLTQRALMFDAGGDAIARDEDHLAYAKGSPAFG